MDPASDRPTAPAGTPDLELLRKFEPVVCYTKGEQFYPMDVEHYIRECSLWEHHPDGPDTLLVRQGELTLEKLIEPRLSAFDTIHYMRFIEPLSLTETAQVLAAQVRLRVRLGEYFFTGIGRLARGGFLPRLLDGLFSLSFLLRGKVSAANAAAAELDYNDILEDTHQYTYYGRVVRQNGWTILQYWFFFCYDSWRSGFHGVNDHEADWEMASLYLYEQDGQLIPEWATYASHDFKGDNYRRRWDDRSELKIQDGHPVIFSGAGSHASYFRRGEYQAEVNLTLPDWLNGVIQIWNKFWTEKLGQPAMDPFHIPFVDFARGNGLHIGPGEHHAWSPVLVNESIPWVSQYRGLWGLFARDPISGENAPAGPMYNRDGSPRGSWYDPLNFAGLDKVPPPPLAQGKLAEDCQNISHRQQELEQLIPDKTAHLQALGIKYKGLEGYPHLAKQAAALGRETIQGSNALHALQREYAENAALLQGLTHRLEQMRLGYQDPPHAHIHHLAIPDNPAQKLRFDRFTEAWASISLSLLLFAIAGLIFFAPRYIWVDLAIILILFLVTDAILRNAFIKAVSRITVILAMIASLILFIHFWKWIILAALLAMGIFLLVQRLRELTG